MKAEAHLRHARSARHRGLHVHDPPRDLREPRAHLAAVGALGALYSLWAIAGAGREAIAWGAVLLATGLPVYAFTTRASSFGVDRVRRDERAA